MSNVVFYGFQFPHHGQFSAFSALSSCFRKMSDIRVCGIPFPAIPSWLPGRVRGSLSRNIFRMQELRLRNAFKNDEIIHYFFPENSLFNGQYWKKGGKLVLSCHQPVAKIMEGNPIWRERFLEGLRASDCIILMASNELAEYSELAPNANVCCIPHGVDTGFFSPKPKYEDVGKIFRILTVGNWMRDYKLWAAVVDCISKRNPNVEFSVLANPNTVKGALDGVKRTECVRVLCGITDEDLRDEYRRADVVFLPLEDAWANNALLESMACGRPLLVTDLPATREYAANAAAFMSKGNVDDAVSQLERLIEYEPIRNELSEMAHAQINKGFSWNKIVESHEQLYATLLTQ